VASSPHRTGASAINADARAATPGGIRTITVEPQLKRASLRDGRAPRTQSVLQRVRI